MNYGFLIPPVLKSFVMAFSVSTGIDSLSRTKVEKCDEGDELPVETAYQPSVWRLYA